MKLDPIDPGARIASRRGSVVVCIMLAPPSDLSAEAVRRVLTHTPRELAIVLLTDDSREPEALSAVEVDGRELYWTETEADPELALARVAALTDPADIVLVPSSCLVATGWIEGLRAAAYADSRVATASALARGALAGGDLDTAAEAIRASSLRLRPPLCQPGQCVFIRRSALELQAGRADGSPRFAEACIRCGLSHVLADDVLVDGPADDVLVDGPAGEASLGPGDCDEGALVASYARARRTLQGLSVLVDARILAKPTSGVQVHVVEVVAALERAEDVRVTALVPSNMSAPAAGALESLSSVDLVTHPYLRGAGAPTFDVVHRPFQLSDPGDLSFLASLGDRLLVTQQDLIGYHNSSYFGSPEDWRGHRSLTRLALATADRVVFLSEHARNEAIGEELVEPERVSVVPNGIDNAVMSGGDADPAPPEALRGVPADAETMLCLGNNYRHKNRLFALRMLERLRENQGWRGYLVFAGPAVAHGSSSDDEAEWLARHSTIAPFVVDVGVISEAEKAWLLGHTRLVVYPTVYEGFGLVPFEAAAHGVPCAWAPGTSLSEVLPDRAAAIVPWNAGQSAERVFELMHSDQAREQNIEAIRTASSRLTWDAAAERLVEAYKATCDAAPTLPSRLARTHQVLPGTVSEDAMRLVGPGGVLPIAVERPLLAVATHPRIAAPVFGALKLGYRISSRLRRHNRR